MNALFVCYLKAVGAQSHSFDVNMTMFWIL